MQEPVVEVEALGKRFGPTVAVEDLTFRVWEGETVGLLGPNGAGKTTVIHMLLGLTLPSCGTIRVFGLPMNGHRVQILQRSNFVSAYTNLPTNLRVLENLRIFALLYGLRRAERKIWELLELVEIPHLARKVTGVLSSGEMTRVNLCKALLNDPELLLLDEPTAGLDPDIADKVRRLLQRLQKERRITMIYTSHNMREIEELCDRVLFLYRGRLLTEGPPKEVAVRFGRKSLEEFFISLAREGKSAVEPPRSASP
ncbi:ABC transporter ATP-binding protein [Candidatus Methylacidithermus pantelleriae]|uniref:ABC transporter ATP-binding protein YbhF n=1 Tax=Candidatus Methylacidithermus pantelleriae TaxID=2744239 RepID=A0A8J2FWV2_9BACT|nr:ABC transporter ATP-binding protein [Candidatus Methylacidithermus pantelleriae]CAF0701164.1 Putative ABC transporter ATP-binding protein YbhF [Candidatus Methylacidithermus pantelleriae]